jgi:hypothetical protein
LAISLRDARERNAAWLHSTAASPSHPSTSGSGGSITHTDPRTYIQTIEKQLSHLRLELSDAYRSRASSQEKQLQLGDRLRERDDECRALRDELREGREREAGGKKRERDWEERYRVREGDVQVSVGFCSFRFFPFSRSFALSLFRSSTLSYFSLHPSSSFPLLPLFFFSSCQLPLSRSLSPPLLLLLLLFTHIPSSPLSAEPKSNPPSAHSTSKTSSSPCT